MHNHLIQQDAYYASMADVHLATLEPSYKPIWLLLAEFCRRVNFESGEMLRRKGNHYTDMYFVVEGSVDVILDNANRALTLGVGSPVGEIGFLKGCSATATAIAREDTAVLLLDNSALLKLEEERPQLLIFLLRALADIAEDRMTQNLSLITQTDQNDDSEISILLCRNKEMLVEAQRIRYSVYCEEIGRTSPYADHDRKTISDNLDKFGHTFIAVDEEEKVIGTLRANFSVEGSLGVLEDIYGMNQSAHHPSFTVICTKFIVDKDRRGSKASAELIKAMRAYVKKAGARECFIDSIPKLVPLYKRIGFTIAGEKFFHYENGPSFPMVLDLTI